MGSRNTILVIEDNRETLENITSLLELAHYDVITASDGHAGVDKACLLKPDLILCDITIPEIDGFSVLHLLSKHMGTALIPFVFLSAKNDTADLRKAMNLGAVDYITKPFDGNELLNVVEMRLQKFQAWRHPVGLADEHPFYPSDSGGFQKLLEKRLVRRFKRKDSIYAQGHNPTEMFFIRSGKIKTYKINHYGKQLIIGLHGAGDCLGYVPLIKDTPYEEGAIALSDSEVSLVPKDDFLSLLYSNSDVAKQFILMLSSSLHEIEKRLVEIAYQSVRQKVVGALLRIYNQYDLAGQKKPVIKVSRRDLSGLIGTSTESLNRTLLDFKDEGLIEFIQGGILLLNKNSLANLLR